MSFRIGGARAGNAATKNFGNDGCRVATTFNAKIGELIGNDALGMKRTKAGFIAKERPPGHGHAAGKKDVDGSIEPDNGNTGVAEKFGSSCLSVAATTESDDGGLFEFDGAAKSGAKLIGFELAECGLAVTFEKLRNGDAGRGFDAFVEIDEVPAKLPS